MEELKKVFNVRDTAFEKKTFEIFELINTSLVCVTNFLNDIDPMFDAGIITWEDANLIDDLIVIIGMVEYEPGTNIEVNDNIISITEENLEYFQRVVHMSLPFDLVTSGDEDNIMEFLYKLHAEGKGDDFSTIIDQAPHSSIDFDLTKLTDEQQQALMLYNPKEKTNN